MDYSVRTTTSVHEHDATSISASFGPAWLCLAAGILFLIVSTGPATEASTEAGAWLTATFLFSLCMLQRALSRSRGEHVWLSVIPLTLNYFFFRYGWGALVMYYWDVLPWQAVPGLRARFLINGGRENIQSACDLAVLGGLGMFLGGLLPVRRIAASLPNIHWPVSVPKLQQRLFLFTPVAIAALFFAEGLPASARFVASLVGSAAYFCIMLGASFLFAAPSPSERTRWLVFCTLATGISLLFGLVIGAVGTILLPFVMIAAAYLMVYEKLPRKAIAIVIPLAFFLLFPVLTVYKESAQRYEQASISDKLSFAWERLQLREYRAAMELVMDRFFARLTLIEFPAVYSRFYPNVYPLANGRTFVLEFSGLVPRVIWPDKPEVSTELNRYAATVGMVKEGDGTSAVFDAVTEYYVNFGKFGVLFLCLLHGWFLSALFAWISRNLPNLLVLTLSTSLFMTNLDLFGLGVVIPSFVKTLAVWIAILYLLSNQRVHQQFYAAPQYLRTNI